RRRENAEIDDGGKADGARAGLPRAVDQDACGDEHGRAANQYSGRQGGAVDAAQMAQDQPLDGVGEGAAEDGEDPPWIDGAPGIVEAAAEEKRDAGEPHQDAKGATRRDL